jgi:hypothetical protein
MVTEFLGSILKFSILQEFPDARFQLGGAHRQKRLYEFVARGDDQAKKEKDKADADRYLQDGEHKLIQLVNNWVRSMVG